MKRITAVLLAMLMATFAGAQKNDTIMSVSGLSHVTVFYGYGASLEHRAKATLYKGTEEVIIDGVALQPDMNSIQIGCPENVTILSYRHRLIYKPRPAISNKIADSLKVLEKKLATVTYDYATQDDILRRLTIVIEGKFATDDNKNVANAELIKVSEYYTNKVQGIKNALYTLQQKKEDIQDKINQLKESNNYDRPDAEQKQTGQLILQVMSNTTAPADFTISYITYTAGWVPSYDIRAKSLDNSLKIAYKAAITQTTGIDWKQVRLSLSTSNPNVGGNVPLLTPEYVKLFVPISVALGRVTSISMRPMASAELKFAEKDKDEVPSSDSLGNVVSYLSTKESQLNISYDIDLPYDIPSTGNAYAVSIKEEAVAAGFTEYDIPKLDKDAFLVAEVPHWENLNLLPGEANIIMDNMYVGKSYIDPNATSDSLQISLGRDKRISVTRDVVKDFTKTQFLGSNKIENFGYVITVKNNKKQAITMVLKDQIPISKLKEIEVNHGELSNGALDDESGIITWNVKLQPGESRKYKFSYSIKYPKDKKLQYVKQ